MGSEGSSSAPSTQGSWGMKRHNPTRPPVNKTKWSLKVVMELSLFL